MWWRGTAVNSWNINGYRDYRAFEMKKFTFKGVLDGFRSSVSQQARADQEIVETLRPDNFQVAKVGQISWQPPVTGRDVDFGFSANFPVPSMSGIGQLLSRGWFLLETGNDRRGRTGCRAVRRSQPVICCFGVARLRVYALRPCFSWGAFLSPSWLLTMLCCGKWPDYSFLVWWPLFVESSSEQCS